MLKGMKVKLFKNLDTSEHPKEGDMQVTHKNNHVRAERGKRGGGSFLYSFKSAPTSPQ